MRILTYYFTRFLERSKDVVAQKDHINNEYYLLYPNSPRRKQIRHRLAFNYKRRQKLSSIHHKRDFIKPLMHKNWIDSWKDCTLKAWSERQFGCKLQIYII